MRTLVSEDHGYGRTQRVQRPGAQDERAQRHAHDRQDIVYGRVGHPRQQDRKDAYARVGAIRDAFADFRHPARALEAMTPDSNDRVAGDDLDQDRKRNQGESHGSSEAYAGGDVQQAHRKSGERQNDQKRESKGCVEIGGVPMQALDVDAAVDQRGDRPDHEGERSNLAPREFREAQRRPGLAAPFHNGSWFTPRLSAKEARHSGS